MTQTLARIKKTGKNFEIIVDMEKALAFKKGEASENFLEIDKIFSDSKKGEVPPSSDLKEAFNTEDINDISEKIVRNGEILVNQEQRNEEHDKNMKQVINFLATNSINPQTGNPHTPERIKNAIMEAHVNIKNVPVENQIQEIINQISKLIPIKIETKKVKIIVPAIYTGQAYGIINPYKEEENWLNDGNLEVIIKIPSGIVMDFYDKLNSVTHGNAITEDIKEEENDK
jgi:ribosome maturation protein SDO1